MNPFLCKFFFKQIESQVLIHYFGSGKDRLLESMVLNVPYNNLRVLYKFRLYFSRLAIQSCAGEKEGNNHAGEQKRND